MTDTSPPPPDPELRARYAACARLGKRITEYAAWLSAGEYRMLEMIREFDRDKLWWLDGAHSCAHWLNYKCGIGMNAAREKVRIANALAKLPQVSAAYRKGTISYSKVRAITRIGTPQNESYLLQIARHGTAAHVEQLVQKYRRCRRLQDQAESVRQHALRELSYFYDERGCLNLRGRLPAETGALVLKALERAMARLEAEARAERKHLRQQHGNSSWKTAPDDRPPGGKKARWLPDVSAETRPWEPFATRRADALVQLAECYLADEAKGSSGADRYQVVVHVSAETLKGEAPAADVSAETRDPFQTDFAYIEDGPHVSAETARRLSCDASLVEVIDDDKGEPLSIGRKSRLIPTGLRRALRMRDDGCRFPGCTHKRYLDCHHVVHWADGGETSLRNLAQLCRYHHRLLHEHGFGCELTADGALRFTNALGKELGRSPTAPVAADAEPLDWLREELDGLPIGADTIVPCMRAGEKIDWHLAVGHLFAPHRASPRPS